MSYKRSVFQAGPVKETAPVGVEVLQEEVNYKTSEGKTQTQPAKKTEKTMSIYLSNTCEFEMQEELMGSVFSDLTLDNPEYQKALKYGKYGKTKHSPHISLFKKNVENGRVIVPRGYIKPLLKLCTQYNIQPNIIDQRKTLKEIDFTFNGKLRDYQDEAVQDILSDSQGVLVSPPGAGKTVIALAVIAERKQPTLILVHTKELLNQWERRIKHFLGIESGIIGAGKMNIQPVTVGTVQTVNKHLSSLPEKFGQVVVDECHKTPASTFSHCVQAFDCRYLLGLTATPFRNDGLGELIPVHLGRTLHKTDKEKLKENGSILKPEIIRRKTSFSFDFRDNYQDMMRALIDNEERNSLIIQDLRESLGQGETALVVSNRIDHLKNLRSLLNMEGTELLIGKTPTRKREKIVRDLEEGRVKALFATLSLLSEGFDCDGLSSLFITCPVKFDGNLEQVVGRVVRPKEGKQAKVYDYMDLEQSILQGHAYQRVAVYNKL